MRDVELVYLPWFDSVEVELVRVKWLYQTLHVCWRPSMTEPLWIILYIM